jgi:hypothetical protein
MPNQVQIPAKPLSDAAIPYIGEWLADAMNHRSAEATLRSMSWYQDQVQSDTVACSVTQALRIRQYVIDECETYEAHGAARHQYPTPADQCDDTCTELPTFWEMPMIFLAWAGMLLVAIGLAVRSVWHWLRNLN